MMRGLFLLAIMLGTGLLLCCAPRVQSGANSPEAGEELRLTRGPCFGFCPVYTVAVTPAGRVDFRGERHTTVLGPRSHSAGRAAYEEVRRALAPLRPASGREKVYPCSAAATDMSLITLEWISSGGQRTALTYRMGCRDEGGRKLEEAVDAALLRLGVRDWAAQKTLPGVPRG